MNFLVGSVARSACCAGESLCAELRVRSRYSAVGIYVFVSLLGGVLTGCKPTTPAGKQVETETVADPINESFEIETVEDPATREIWPFLSGVRSNLRERRWEELEAQAAALRSEGRAVFDDGSYKIVYFYWAMSPAEEASDAEWAAREVLLSEWLKARPFSLTALIAKAEFLTSFGWRARTSKWAREVTPEGWRLFRERLDEATILLKEAKRLDERDPMWWMTSMKIAMGLSFSDSQQYRLFEEAIAFDPKCWHFDVVRATALLPRWGGRRGEWEAHAAKAAARTEGLGAEVYARIANDLAYYHDYFFDETGASWPKTKEGFELIRQRYPKSLAAVHESAFLASNYGDYQFGLEMADLIGNRFLPDVWTDQDEFLSFLVWAGEVRLHLKTK
ncbi:MAG: DUF4034 domain-containing protein [Verrucomicrobiota bacterium]